jgi:pimeloyl-ACP methyl ester carboxylesterase
MHSTAAPPGRPRVYFLHGLLGTAYAHFGNQISAWNDRYAVVPVDLPGHGRCPIDAGTEYLDEAFDYVIAVLGRFGPGRLVAASYLGGPLAVRCATERPELVTSLVLTGFSPGLPRDVFLGWLAGFHHLVDVNPDLATEFERLHTVRWKQTLAAFAEHAEQAYEQRALVRPEALGALGVQTLLVNGSVKSVERTAAERAAELGPRVRGHVVDGAGHIAGHDAPAAFNAAVEAFWDEGGVR